MLFSSSILFSKRSSGSQYIQLSPSNQSLTYRTVCRAENLQLTPDKSPLADTQDWTTKPHDSHTHGRHLSTHHYPVKHNCRSHDDVQQNISFFSSSFFSNPRIDVVDLVPIYLLPQTGLFLRLCFQAIRIPRFPRLHPMPLHPSTGTGLYGVCTVLSAQAQYVHNICTVCSQSNGQNAPKCRRSLSDEQQKNEERVRNWMYETSLISS